MIPLTHKMHNGASISDWLGTAATAASSATVELQRARDPETVAPEQCLTDAITYLEQALEEARAVQGAAAHVAAFGPVAKENR